MTSLIKLQIKRNFISNEFTQTDNKISNEISEVKESSQKVISDGISNFNPIESIKNILKINSTSQNSKSIGSSPISSSLTTPPTTQTTSITYEILFIHQTAI